MLRLGTPLHPLRPVRSALCQSRASGNLVKVHCSPKGTERQRSSAAQRRLSTDFCANACPSKFACFIPTGRDWKTRACLQIGNYYILFKHLRSAEEWRKLCVKSLRKGDGNPNFPISDPWRVRTLTVNTVCPQDATSDGTLSGNSSTRRTTWFRETPAKWKTTCLTATLFADKNAKKRFQFG